MVTEIDSVMLIDDEIIDHKIYKRVLKRSGIVGEIHGFTMGDDALSFLEASEDRVDVIFLDINMPRMNGFEFLDRATDRLGTRLDDTIVLMLTTSLNPRDEDRAAGYPVIDGYFGKPLTDEHIRKASDLLRDLRQRHA